MQANYENMNGIVRYVFGKDSAKQKVEDAVEIVNPHTIANLVASNTTDKQKENAMVDALVLWKPTKVNLKFDYRRDVRFELVSRFVEKKVAEKLSRSDVVQLLKARRQLSPLSGAEGYAGALFEASAIKKSRQHGDHSTMHGW